MPDFTARLDFLQLICFKLSECSTHAVFLNYFTSIQTKGRLKPIFRRPFATL